MRYETKFYLRSGRIISSNMSTKINADSFAGIIFLTIQGVGPCPTLIIVLKEIECIEITEVGGH